jgi:geranylgeranyl diphosphate synthase type II
MSSERTSTRRRQVPHDIRQQIDRLRDRALRSVMLSLPSDEPRQYLYDLLPQYPTRGGKGLRPVLCMASCAAFGGSYDDALPFAAALELLHNAFLIHDDIQDASQLRRGGPALHAQHGTALALNAGDALAAAANAAFLRAVRPLRPRVSEALLEGWERMTRETIEGQALDLGWQHHEVLDMSTEDYLEMCAKKTAWYTAIQPLAIGAIIGSGNPAIERETFQFGWLLGVLFQIANDLDGVQLRTGKSDLTEGKRTILMIHLLDALDGEDRDRVAQLMNQPRHQRTPDEVEWVHAQLQERGSIDYVTDSLGDLADATNREAKRTFGSLPPSDGRNLLLSITDYVLQESGLR